MIICYRLNTSKMWCSSTLIGESFLSCTSSVNTLIPKLKNASSRLNATLCIVEISGQQNQYTPCSWPTGSPRCNERGDKFMEAVYYAWHLMQAYRNAKETKNCMRVRICTKTDKGSEWERQAQTDLIVHVRFGQYKYLYFVLQELAAFFFTRLCRHFAHFKNKRKSHRR